MARAVRPFVADDAAATHAVFVRAVREGAASRYSLAERDDWLPDPTMPDDWGDWLAEHITLVATEGGAVTGFFMLERDGYLNMAFVLPECMGKGTADALYAALLPVARDLGLSRMTTLASRFAQGFFRRHGWHPAPDLPPRDGQDPDQRPGANPQNRPMAIDLG